MNLDKLLELELKNTQEENEIRLAIANYLINQRISKWVIEVIPDENLKSLVDRLNEEIKRREEK